jgi:pimeloyl-ACP methyl ester carboxylesterase
MAVTTERSAGDTTIRPFTIEIPESALEDLRARIAATRFPERETVEDFSQGVPLATMQALARYWANEYDWRKCEARMNAYPQFVTEVDGLDIHQMKIVDLLTDPTAHGGSASDAFDVVIPNMPGYGFSGKPTTTGWGPFRIGEAWVELMKRLGYERFVAAGGDWGGVIVEVMAGGRDAPASPQPPPPELLGIHTNFPGVVPPEIDRAIQTGGQLPADLSDDERRTTEQLAFLYQHVAYGAEMGSRPQTLYGLADSPARPRRDEPGADLPRLRRWRPGGPEP